MVPFTELNANAGWCWFQDPRVIVDASTGALLCASVASPDGVDGEARDGNVEVTWAEAPNGPAQRVPLARIRTAGHGDDHSCPALWQRPDGRYLAVYTGHNFGNGRNAWSGGTDTAPLSFTRISVRPHDATEWGPQCPFAWPAEDPVGMGMIAVTYSNLCHLSAEGGERGRLYNIARAGGQLWHVATSDDWGESWTWRGPVTMPPAGGRDYSNGYMKFCDNGTDRIDFITTEAHPRDFNNGLYHGHIRAGTSRNAAGEVVDPDPFSGPAPRPESFTPLWRPDAVGPSAHHHAWAAELRRGPAGQLFALFTTRFGTAQSPTFRRSGPGDADHRLFFARFDGHAWRSEELAPMGEGLNPHQEDYTGLATVDPRDGLTVYVSTPFDPRDGARLPCHEIFRARRPKHDAPWSWSAVTSGSSRNNLRPQLVERAPDRRTLLWLRGTYGHPHHYRQALVAAEVD